jgi:hypothetical protein
VLIHHCVMQIPTCFDMTHPDSAALRISFKVVSMRR